jgi:hypothetical protein
MKIIEAAFKLDYDKHQDADSDTRRQAGYIDDGIIFISQ